MKIPREIASKADNIAGRGWVVRQVADWAFKGTERFLAITGEPGSGKTALAAWLAGAGPTPGRAAEARALDRVRGMWTATHFCIPRQEGTIDGVAFATSIAGQLAERLGDDYLPAVARANNTSIRGTASAEGEGGTAIGVQIAELVVAVQSRADTSANVTALWQGAVRMPLQELDDPQAYLMVDALDEAARGPRPNIVSLLAGSDDLPPGVRIVVTMSTELDARALFPAARLIDLSGPESEADANADVRAFIRARLKPSRADEDRLVAAAAGNFLYISFLVGEVARGIRSIDSVGMLPGGLYPLYGDYLDRVTRTQPGGVPGTRWERELQPVLGCISVATPSAPRAALAQWLRRDAGRVGRLLTEARQLTEQHRSPDGAGYRLYHRSMSDFLAADEYGGNGAQTVNRYHTPPAVQHARIAAHYLHTSRDVGWAEVDPYGLRHVVRHLKGAAAPELAPAQRRRHTADMYATVLDPRFQAAQADRLGLRATLDDLQRAVEVALAGEEMLPLLQCVAGYRAVAGSGEIAGKVFAAVDRGDFETALQYAVHYGPPPRPRGRWARVLDAWISWHAARRGDAAKALEAAEGVVGRWLTPQSEAEPLYWQLCRALIVRAGRALSERGLDPDPVLRVFRDQHAEMAAEVRSPPAEAPAGSRLTALTDELQAQLITFQMQLRDDPYEGVEAPFANAEYQASQATNLRDLLISLAALPEGQQAIDRTLGPTLNNPYPRYRDIGLVALGGAAIAVPDDEWADRRLRSILVAGLNAEGVTFTFDLPTLVLHEARRRGQGAAALAAVVDRARAHADDPDRWATGVRALSAEAAALAAGGDVDAAMATLVEASRAQVGFAGYASATYLALTSRCVAFGRPEAADDPVWGPYGSTLINLAGEHASRILDVDFREERLELVRRYADWLRQPPPTLSDVHALMGTMPDPDARRAYKDFASAHWTVAGTSEARGWLKSIVPMVIEDTTTLDTILSRVLAPRLSTIEDKELAKVVDVVATGLTSGRPWEMGISVE